jgi:hypothetical protein
MQLPGPMYHQAEHIPITEQHFQSNSIIQHEFECNNRIGVEKSIAM